MSATRGRVLSTAVGAASLLGWISHADAARSPNEGAASAQTVKLPSGPGSIRGLAEDPSVDEFSGQASYRVPLELPKAARGFAPEVSLAYHGELGNGPLGIGWTVGVPLVRRSTQQGVPTYGAGDTLELSGVAGGGRLVRISADGASAEYRVEGEGNRLRILELTGGGFEVHGPDGTRYRLGVSAASRQASGARVAAWMADEVVDVAGQRVKYSYESHAGQLYLTRIAWGPESRLAAVFELEARPDEVVSWRTGFEVKTSRRVRAVRVEAFGEVQRRHELGYDTTFALSRLARVTTIGRGGVDPEGKNSLPPLVFGYAQKGVAATERLAVDDWRLGDTTVLADVDGDGAADLVQLRDGSHKYRQNRGGSFGPEITITGASSLTLLGDEGARLADVEGKNVPNLIARTNLRWAPYRISIAPPASPGGLPTATWATWSAWNAESTANVPFRGDSVVLTDVNGDARMDAVTWTASNLVVRLGNGNGLAAPVTRSLIAGTVKPDPMMRWLDVNGDSLADIVYLRTGGFMRVYLGHGDGTFEPFQDVPYPAGASASSDLRFGDLDRDGLLDAVLVTQAEVRWFQGLPGNRFADAPRVLTKPDAASTEALVTIQDANGNGSEDVVWSSNGPGGGVWALDLAGPTSAGMLVEVDNGLGKRLTIDYTATTALAGAAAAAGRPWTSFLPIAIPVVTRTVNLVGGGELPRIVDFVVRDGFWDTGEHRFGGFVSSTKIVRGGADGDLVTETFYHTGNGANRVLRGRPTRVNRSIVVGGVTTTIDSTANTWTAKKITSLPNLPAPAGDLLRKAVLSSAKVDTREGRPAGAPLSTRTTITYDGEGRPILEIQEGRLDLVGDERRIERRFAESAAPWVRDLPAEEKVLGADGAVVSWTQSFYGDDTASHPIGVAGKGWKRRELAYLATEDRWVERGAWRYDALGNLVQSIEDGVKREMDYDALGLHAVEERLHTSATASLRWRFGWDEVLGAPTSITGPDGVTMRVAYDGLARPIAQSKDDAHPHVIYEYDWRAPRPSTSTFSYDGPGDAVPARPAVWTAGSGWRHQVAVADGEGQQVYKLTRLADERWLVSDWIESDARGRVVFRGETVEWTGASGPIARPAGMVGTSLRYDPLDRELSQQLADGSLRVNTYAAFTVTTTSEGLAPITIEKDGHDQVVHNRRGDERIAVSYDAAGRLTGYRHFVDGQIAEAARQTYAYDSLGRLVRTEGSDGGARVMAYDDGGRLVRVTNAAGQHVALAYDAAGRLLERTLDDATRFTYHYDAACPGSGAGTSGRLACVDEPTGRASFGYDGFGNLALEARVVDGVGAVRSIRSSASGAPLATSFDGRVDLDIAYDPAGRAVRIGDVWTLEEQDAAGRVLVERYGNGVRQRTVRDLVGLPGRIDVVGVGGETLYGITITRAPWGAVSAIEDDDGRGLDHSASFSYDGKARLVRAVLGGGESDSFDLGYAYDGLQNMTQRTVVGPKALGSMSGSYRYGEGAGPRQLTSIAADDGSLLHTFAYDPAGRQVREDGKGLAWNALDQLLQVTTAAGTTTHAYGHDGQRVRTVGPDGVARRWLGEGIAQTGSVREYDVTLGDRVLARVAVDLAEPAGGESAGLGALGRGLWLAFVSALALGLLAWARRSARHPVWARVTASATVLLVLQACAGGGGGAVGVSHQALGAPRVTYFHQGVSPGPVLFTGADGAIVEERRYEPFGQAIDAWRDGQVGEIDHVRVDLGVLNQPVDPSTGWSDHGARWFASQTGRWQSIDPPTLTGDVKYAAEPWSLHPYQYTDQNPILYWDPDGRDKVSVFTSSTASDAEQQKPRAVTTIAPGQTVTKFEPYKKISIFGWKLWGYPTGAQLGGHPVVKKAMKKSWADSFNRDGSVKQEQGGWIYWNSETGKIKVKRAPGGTGASIDLWNPPAMKGYEVVGVWHTHPNPSTTHHPDPSPADLTNAGIRNVPSLVISDKGVYVYGSDFRGKDGTVKLTNP